MLYRINRPQVITETIGGEAVVIHQGTGAYYSIAATGATVWAGVEAERPVDEIVAYVEANHEAPREVAVAPSVQRLLSELLQEDLIVVAEDDRPRGELPLASAEKRPFEAPALRKFTDMQDLILIDPVHEVDQRGWPHADPGARAGDGG